MMIITLNYECVSDKDYLDTANVWNMFEMKTTGYTFLSCHLHVLR